MQNTEAMERQDSLCDGEDVVGCFYRWEASS